MPYFYSTFNPPLMIFFILFSLVHNSAAICLRGTSMITEHRRGKVISHPIVEIVVSVALLVIGGFMQTTIRVLINKCVQQTSCVANKSIAPK